MWRALTLGSRELRWTDDTQMAIDVAESWLACGAFDGHDLVTRFAAGYRWSRGYGPSMARALKRVRRGLPWHEAARVVHSDGSFGNGAAMRSHVVGLVASQWSAARRRALAEQIAATTHAHPDGVFGAVVMAEVVAAAARGEAPAQWWAACAGLEPAGRYARRLHLASARQGAVDPAWARAELGNGVRAVDSVVTAVHLAASAPGDFAGMLRCARRLGGDVDTIGAMAGAILGAAGGLEVLPVEESARVERREYLLELADRLEALHGDGSMANSI